MMWAVLSGCPEVDEPVADDTDAAADRHDDDQADDAPTDDTDAALDSASAGALCACLFASCHDAYHLVWGEDEITASQSCSSAASDWLAVEGEAECRMEACERVTDDDVSACDQALSDETCVP